MSDYCCKEVEPMGKECEQLHISALVNYFGSLEICLEYLDGRFALMSIVRS